MVWIWTINNNNRVIYVFLVSFAGKVSINDLLVGQIGYLGNAWFAATTPRPKAHWISH